MQLESKPPDVTHASVPPICVFMKCNEFRFLALCHTGAWCITAQRAFLFFFSQEMISKSILNTSKQWYFSDAASATGCFSSDDTFLWHIVCPRSTPGAFLSGLTGDLDILLVASKGHSPSSVCIRAWICSSGALWMCDRLPRRGVIPKASSSNRVIYYTVQLFLPPLLLPHPLFTLPLSYWFSLPLPLHQHFVRTNEK